MANTSQAPFQPYAPPGYAAAPVVTNPGGAPENGPPIPGRLRTIPVGKTIGLGILTLGIYVHMKAFKSSGDLHRIQGGWTPWKTFFWLGFVPYLGFVFTLVLYWHNNKQCNVLRQQRGLQASWAPFILACIPVVWIVAPFVWAGHFNEVARST